MVSHVCSEGFKALGIPIPLTAKNIGDRTSEEVKVVAYSNKPLFNAAAGPKRSTLLENLTDQNGYKSPWYDSNLTGITPSESKELKEMIHWLHPSVKKIPPGEYNIRIRISPANGYTTSCQIKVKITSGLPVVPVSN